MIKKNKKLLKNKIKIKINSSKSIILLILLWMMIGSDFWIFLIFLLIIIRFFGLSCGSRSSILTIATLLLILSFICSIGIEKCHELSRIWSFLCILLVSLSIDLLGWNNLLHLLLPLMSLCLNPWTNLSSDQLLHWQLKILNFLLSHSKFNHLFSAP